MGVWNAHTNVGNVLGSIIAGAFVNYQWGASFLAPGFLLIVGAYVVYLVLVDHPAPELNLSSYSRNSTENRHKSLTGYYGDVKVEFLFTFSLTCILDGDLLPFMSILVYICIYCTIAPNAS